MRRKNTSIVSSQGVPARYGDVPLRPKGTKEPTIKVKGLGRDFRKYRSEKNIADSYLRSARTTLFLSLLNSIVLILVVFALVLYPMNRSLPYNDQMIVSTSDYLTQLSAETISFKGHEVEISLTDSHPIDHYGVIYIDVLTPDGLKNEEFESINCYSDINIIKSGQAVFEFYIHGNRVTSYCTAIYEETAVYCAYVPSFEVISEPDAGEFLLSLEMYCSDDNSVFQQVSLSDLLANGFRYLSDCIIYGRNTALKLLPQNIAKPRRDFGVTIPWRC